MLCKMHGHFHICTENKKRYVFLSDFYPAASCTTQISVYRVSNPERWS